MSKKLMLLDGLSIVSRAFYGMPDTTNKEGVHTNAVAGCLNLMLQVAAEEDPGELVAVWGRVMAPARALQQQFSLMKELLASMNVTTVESEEDRACDMIAALAAASEETVILSAEKQLLQLVSDHVKVRMPARTVENGYFVDYTPETIREQYHVEPGQLADVFALAGDGERASSDHLGIGVQKAAMLIETYGTVEAVRAHLDEIQPPYVAERIDTCGDYIVADRDRMRADQTLTCTDALADAAIGSVEELWTPKAKELCEQLGLSCPTLEAAPKKQSFTFTAVESLREAEKIWGRVMGQPLAFHIIAGDANVSAQKEGQLSLFAEETDNQFFGMAIAMSGEEGYLFVTGDELTSDYLLDQLLHCRSTRLLTDDIKKQLELLMPFEQLTELAQKHWEEYLQLRERFFDRTLAAYLLDPLAGDYPYEQIAKDYLGIELLSETALLGKQSIPAAYLEKKEQAVQAACYQTMVTWNSYEKLTAKLEQEGMLALYHEIELPLAFVLSDMEREGICMDTAALKEYGEQLFVSIAALEEKIYEKAGESFNINSPKQLGVILFDKLGLPNGKKTKTGYSTSAEVLEKLADDYPIVSDILEYRQLTKLKSTYADGLVNFVEEDGRIHTTFNQTITATGRLSSADPNLQNIPIRIELGRMIRKVFHPKEGCLFIDSDYSQIELRLLAHMSGDQHMIDAFRNHQDIHRSTASLVFHTPFEEVTDLQRRNAKAVNFGIVYGISAFGLSQDLNISRSEAQKFIDRYFETYPRIKAFLDGAVANAKKDGCTKTMYGRIRPIPELASSNFNQRQFGERVAMNAPIQGTAADIIKIAMIRVHDRLYREGFASRLILQVHDELLIETAEQEKEQVRQLLEEEMHGAADLSVELEVGTECGYNWYDAH